MQRIVVAVDPIVAIRGERGSYNALADGHFGPPAKALPLRGVSKKWFYNLLAVQDSTGKNSNIYAY
jgi:hypothetical protein